MHRVNIRQCLNWNAPTPKPLSLILWTVVWAVNICQIMHRMQHFGKRKFGGSNHNNNPSEYFASPKNQRIRPCRDIVYTEDRVPVRKLYFCVAASEVSMKSRNYAFTISTYCIIWNAFGAPIWRDSQKWLKSEMRERETSITWCLLFGLNLVKNGKQTFRIISSIIMSFSHVTV